MGFGGALLAPPQRGFADHVTQAADAGAGRLSTALEQGREGRVRACWPHWHDGAERDVDAADGISLERGVQRDEPALGCGFAATPQEAEREVHVLGMKQPKRRRQRGQARQETAVERESEEKIGSRHGQGARGAATRASLGGMCARAKRWVAPRARGIENPLSFPTQGQTGIGLLHDAIAGKLPAGPLLATLGCELVEVSDGFARFELLPSAALYSPAHAVHGGVLATVLDAAMGAAVLTTLDAASGYTTATLTVQLTRAISPRTAKMTAEGWVVHRGSRLVTAEGRVKDEQGRLLAHGSATCALIERPSS